MSGSKWGVEKIEALAEYVTVGYVGSMSTLFVIDGVPLLRGQNIREYALDLSNLKYISQETHRKWKKSELKPGDVAIVRVGYPGTACVIPDDVGEMNAASLVIVRPNRAKLDAKFLSYVLNSPWGKAQISGRLVGAAQQVFNTQTAAELEIPSPPLNIQQRISSILSAYDELIENSQRRIKILESMARAAYTETLSTSTREIESHSIVESSYWRFISENVSNYLGTKRYYATADVDGLVMIGPGIDYSFAERPSRAQKQPIPNSVWFARMKETFKIAWFGPLNDERASGTLLSTGFAGFEARDAELWPLLFLIISSREFHVQKDLFCTGATQMSLTNEGLSRIRLPLPDEQSARRLGRTVGPLLTSMAGLQQRNDVLRRTRDLLLPRLLSGQIDVEAIA